MCLQLAGTICYLFYISAKVPKIQAAREIHALPSTRVDAGYMWLADRQDRCQNGRSMAVYGTISQTYTSIVCW